MVWSYGCNPKVDIINLTDAETNEIIFASSHFPIIYNYCEKKMSYLEGHVSNALKNLFILLSVSTCILNCQSLFHSFNI